jgi:hypothetical protein
VFHLKREPEQLGQLGDACMWVFISQLDNYKCIISIYMCKCIILDMYIVNGSVEPCKVVSFHAKHKCQTHTKKKKPKLTWFCTWCKII